LSKYRKNCRRSETMVQQTEYNNTGFNSSILVSIITLNPIKPTLIFPPHMIEQERMIEKERSNSAVFGIT